MFHKLIVSPILPRKSAPASLLARVRALAESSKIEVTSISCSLKDNSFGKVSGCRRILKQFPQLFSTSLGAATAASEAAELGVISNMTEPWEYAFSDEVRPRFSMDLLCEIAEGIPRRWPVGSAVIVLDLARWPGFDVPPDDFRPKLRGPIEWDRLTEYWKPSIVASTIRDPWGRRDELHAIIPLLPPPEPGESELRLNDQLRDCLRTLGSSAKIQVQITRSPEEEEAMIQERSDLYGLIEEHCTNLQDILLPVMTLLSGPQRNEINSTVPYLLSNRACFERSRERDSSMTPHEAVKVVTHSRRNSQVVSGSRVYLTSAPILVDSLPAVRWKERTLNSISPFPWRHSTRTEMTKKLILLNDSSNSW